jgi:CDP-diacylglycerol pyrophosphatase
MKKKIILVSSVLILIIVIIGALIVYSNQSKKSTVLYAGNVLVPQKWHQRAIKDGYYCPSWNANAASQIEVGSICLKLNKNH